MKKLGDRQRYRNSPLNRLVFGIFIVAIGVLALIDNLGLFDTRQILSFWPTFFIIFGILHIARTRRATGFFYGGVMLAVGLLLTLQNLGYLVIHWREWWPVFIILGGISYMLKGLTTRNINYGGPNTPDIQNDSTANADRNAHSLEIVAIMSGSKTNNASPNFTGGEITAIMGSAEIDLRGASIQSEAAIELYVVMGNVEIFVPGDWIVVSSGIPILGGIEDHSVPPMNPAKRLVISGLVVMGGVEIKN